MDINNKKVCLNNNVPNANSDRISSLPDAILQHILSFVDIKHGVQTSVLSKRWQCVWTNIPCLNFHLDGYPSMVTEERRNSFVNFIDQVLSRRCISDIHRFSFYSGAAIDVSRLGSFVDYALQRNVQILEITYSNLVIKPNGRPKMFLSYEMSHLEFTSKSLSVLKLTGCDHGSIYLPKTLSLITLKELHLKNISLTNYTAERELVCDCLECLTLVDCCFGDLESLKISAPRLANLEILSPYLAGSKEFPWTCNIIVFAPNLSSFKYYYHIPLLCSMGNPLNINTVDINIWKHYRATTKTYDKEMGRRMTAMLLEFQHARSVTLSLRAMKILSKVPGVLDQHSSPFRNLKNFRVNLERSSFLRGLNYILQDSLQAKTTLIAPSFRFNMEDNAK